VKAKPHHRPRILFVSPCGPYLKAPVDADPVDFFYYRNTLGQGLFRLKSFQSWYSLHFIAQNISVPSVVLENPTMEGFKAEISNGSYEVVAIGFTVVTAGRVLEMVRWLKKDHPSIVVILGGYGTAIFRDPDDVAGELQELADRICYGEGVQFMREYTYERWQAEGCGVLTQDFLPMEHCFFRTSIPIFRQLVILGALGCTFGCPFCATSSQFARRKIIMATPSELVRNLEAQVKKHPGIRSAILYDEDFLVDRRRVLDFMDCMEQSRTLSSRPVLLTVFASVDSIRRYSTEELVRCGIGTIYIGVESFVGEVVDREELSKRNGDVEAIFEELHRNGINTLGSFIIGWDGQTPSNIHTDIRRFVSLNPTFYQVVPLHPVPGTPLWEKVKKGHRMKNDYSFATDSIDRFSFELQNLPEEDAVKSVRQTYTDLVSEGGPWPFRLFENLLQGWKSLAGTGKPWGTSRSVMYRSLIPEILPLAVLSRFLSRGEGFSKRWKRTMSQSMRDLPLLTSLSVLLALFMLPVAVVVYTFAVIRQWLNPRGEQPEIIRVEYTGGRGQILASMSCAETEDLGINKNVNRKRHLLINSVLLKDIF